MTGLPSPRNIRRAWVRRSLSPQDATKFLARWAFLSGRGPVAEARCWSVARGKWRGQMKRVDILFESGSTVSIRCGTRVWKVLLGMDVCV